MDEGLDQLEYKTTTTTNDNAMHMKCTYIIITHHYTTIGMVTHFLATLQETDALNPRRDWQWCQTVTTL